MSRLEKSHDLRELLVSVSSDWGQKQQQDELG